MFGDGGGALLAVATGMSGSTTPTVARAAGPSNALQTGLWKTGGSSLGQRGISFALS